MPSCSSFKGELHYYGKKSAQHLPTLVLFRMTKTCTELMKRYKRNVYRDCVVFQKSVTVLGHKTYSLLCYVLATVWCLSSKKKKVNDMHYCSSFQIGDWNLWYLKIEKALLKDIFISVWSVQFQCAKIPVDLLETKIYNN